MRGRARGVYDERCEFGFSACEFFLRDRYLEALISGSTKIFLILKMNAYKIRDRSI